uniref:Uncharacterized protein n=1 Tax=Physcomitrium patens TaxID=3218 RepID=A0A2K1KA95_PHYPA|nr:hypothetical protein PHYPA_009886 [Physcomitrium patens]
MDVHGCRISTSLHAWGSYLRRICEGCFLFPRLLCLFSFTHNARASAISEAVTKSSHQSAFGSQASIDFVSLTTLTSWAESPWPQSVVLDRSIHPTYILRRSSNTDASSHALNNLLAI